MTLPASPPPPAAPLARRRATVESCDEQIDVRVLVRRLRQDHADLWNGWAATGAAVVFPAVQAGEAVLTLRLDGLCARLAVTWSKGEQEVRLTAVPALRGLRWFQICPVSAARVFRLFRPPEATEYASAPAHKLIYAVALERPVERPACRLRRRLGQSPAVFGSAIPPPPAGMLASLYLDLCDQLRVAEAAVRPRAKRHTTATPGPRRGGLLH